MDQATRSEDSASSDGETSGTIGGKLASPQLGPQLAAIEATWCFELLYGGARGGGKSFFLLMDYLQDVPKYGRNWQGIFIRKTYPELEQAIRDSWKIFPQTGATFEKQPKTWTWPNGASLRFRNLETAEDAQHYQGHSYTWFGGDEMGNYPSADVYTLMLATLRSADAPIPTRARLTANPGGPGHHWLKQRFIDPSPLGYMPIKDPESKRERMFIPSRITDNRLLLENDPAYIDNLKLQATPELVRAWLLGDWDVQISSFFPEFQKPRHVIPPFLIPQHWFRFRSFDWGSSHPFCVLWFAVSDGTQIVDSTGKGKLYPRGTLICYREWYGMEPGRPNVGIKLKNEEIAAGILRRTHPLEKITFTTTDSLPFQERGGPTIAETFARHGVRLKRGDTSRIPGWQQLRSRLQNDSILFFPECVHTIRTLPALQADKHNFEDIDDRLEDHAADCVRLACMERPLVKEKAKPIRLKPLSEMTFDELLKWEDMHGNRFE